MSISGDDQGRLIRNGTVELAEAPENPQMLSHRVAGLSWGQRKRRG